MSLAACCAALIAASFPRVSGDEPTWVLVL